jgi:hypothetical protein
MITVIAVICSLASGQCHNETVTNTDLSNVSLQGCLMGAPQLADWMKQWPGYRLASWKCQIGNRGNVV